MPYIAPSLSITVELSGASYTPPPLSEIVNLDPGITGGGAAFSVDAASGAGGSWYGGGDAASIDALGGAGGSWYGSGSAASVDSAAGGGGAWYGGGAAYSIDAAAGVAEAHPPAQKWIALGGGYVTTASLRMGGAAIVTKSLIISQRYLETVSKALRLMAVVKDTTEVQKALPLSAPHTVAKSIRIVAPVRAEISKALTLSQRYAAAPQTVYKALRLACAIRQWVDKALTLSAPVGQPQTVSKALRLRSRIGAAPASVYSAAVEWRWKGERISADGTPRASEGGNWNASLRVYDIATAARMRTDDHVTCQIGATTWNFLIDSLERSARNTTGREMTAGLVGVAALLDSPRAAPISRDFPATIMARAACESLAGSAIDWRILDWPIAPYTLSAANEAPLAVIRRVAEAVGAVVESTPAGTLVVRSRSPVRLPDLAAATPDATLSEAASIYERRAALAWGQGAGAVSVGDADEQISDALEFETDPANPLRATLWAYPSPDRPVELRDTHTGVTLGGRFRTLREKTRQIVFEGGIAKTQYPIYRLVAVEWLNQIPGTVTHAPGSTEIRTSPLGDGLANVTYQTAAYGWDASADTDLTALFILEDPNG